MNVLYLSVPLKYVERETDPKEPLFVDFETLGLYGDIVLAQFKQSIWDVAYLVEYPNENALREFLRDQWVVCYNIAYDMGTLGLAPNRMDDLYFAAKTAYPLQDSHSLADTAPVFYAGISKSEMQKSFMKQRASFTEEQLHYGALDVYALEWLWDRDGIKDVIFDNLAYRVDIKAQRHALDYEHNGMPVIESAWREAKEATECERQEYQRELNRIVGFDLNVKSFQQKQKAFPELPIDPKTGKIPTGEPAFKKLYLETKDEKYNLVMKTTKRRTQLSDLEKYRESYYPDESPVRIRTFFSVAGAITGRFTSKGGDRVGYTNIQNIGRHFKKIFGYESNSNRSIVSADYGTAELIAGCAIFNIPTMKDLIMNGVDLHKAMASEITGKGIDDITKEERQSAKAVNFGFLFGMGTERFQAYAYDTFGVKLTESECEEYKEVYYTAHPAIKAYHKDMGKKMSPKKKATCIVETALGRRVNPDRYMDALNIPVQGTIAECTKMAINYLYEDNPNLMKEVKLVNMVHDSIVIDTPDEHIDEVSQALVFAMKEAWREISKTPLFSFHELPIGVDVDISKEWK